MTERSAPASAAVPVLEAVGISKTYTLSAGWFAAERKLQAVREVSFALKRGETLGIVGESGCGKSTVAKILLGLVPHDEGTIRLGGRPSGEIGRLEFSRHVQPVFQDPYSTLNPRRTVIETVQRPLEVHRIGNAASRRKAAEELLDLVGLPRRAHDGYPNQLSGGQRQRVAIARALVLKPEILICDEPTSALDVSIQAQILNLITALQRELNVSIIFISHNLAVVEHLADRVAVMYLGRVVEIGATAAVMARPRHPYTKALLASVLTPDPALGLPELNLGTSYPDPTNIPKGCSFHPRCAFRKDVCLSQEPMLRALPGQEVACLRAEEIDAERLVEA